MGGREMNIARRLTLFAHGLVLSVLFTSHAAAQLKLTGCHWVGTAPFCDGACGENETEITQLASIPDGSQLPTIDNSSFGQPCATGTKALCCSAPGGLACRWSGTAPFCNGSCNRPGEMQSQPPFSGVGISSGRQCVAGTKVFCCHKAITSSQSALQADPEFTRFAAFWVKGGGPAWQASHDLTASQYDREFEERVREGYRLVEIAPYGVGNTDMYATIWVQQKGPPWQAHVGLTAAQHQEEFTSLVATGYRLVHIDGYTVGNDQRYASIWEQSAGPSWESRVGLTPAQCQEEFETLPKQGYRLVDVSGYTISGQDRYAVIWEKRVGPAWEARNGLTSSQYQTEFNDLSKQGYRISRLKGWRSGNTAHFAAIWEKVAGSPWIARHSMLSDTYQEESNALSKEGYRLEHISAYHTSD
jgi:Bacterial tandem repeat domain 1